MEQTKKGNTLIEGTVSEALPDATFKVALDDDREVLAHASGKIRNFRIRILVGDRVRVEMTPYDENRGRLVFRLNK